MPSPADALAELALIGGGLFLFLAAGLAGFLAWLDSPGRRRRRNARAIRRHVRRVLDARAVLGPDVELPYPG